MTVVAAAAVVVVTIASVADTVFPVLAEQQFGPSDESPDFDAFLLPEVVEHRCW